MSENLFTINPKDYTAVCYRCKSEDYEHVPYRGLVCPNCGEITAVELVRKKERPKEAI